MKNAVVITTLLFIVSSALGKSTYSARRLNQLSGEKSAKFDSKSEWDKAYSRPSFIFGKSPAKFLAENFDYLPPGSKILDMGMGEGRNAVFLAQKGHKITGIDISSVAIKKSRMLAKEFGVKIKGVVATLNKYKIPENSFDAIICFYFVDRSLVNKMKKWLKPGGIIIYEAYTMNQAEKKANGKYAKEQYLKPKELLSLFDGMNILKYEEPLHEKSYRASAIFRKPIEGKSVAKAKEI